MYQDTITLFNLYESEEAGALWYPTVISYTQLQIDTAANLRERGPESADSASLHIRYARDGKNTIISGIISFEDNEAKNIVKPYTLPKKWACAEDKEAAVTFTKDKDFFYHGIWKGDAPIKDSEYGKKGFYDYMKRNEDEVFLITNVGKYNLLPHFEIGGK